ncbi:MAG: DNA repair protein RecN [Bacteroidales bacterium]|nr:DNA repair protein RecN [Bacteroidales bacterium]
MLRSLHIENYVLIDSLDISFPEGLSIITGRTGAGKSILLGALGLLLGAKSDAAAVSEGASSCIVEGEFDSPEELRDLLEEAGTEWDPAGLIIRRVIPAAGRSRSFVNDCPVQAALLSELAERLVDIHSQDQTRLLRDRGFQLSVLDHFAGVSGKVRECSALWKEILLLNAEAAKLRARIDSLQGEADYNAAQYGQLEQAKLVPGELEELEAEQKQLAHAEAIKEAFAAAINAFTPDELPSIDVSLKEAARQLDKAAAFVPGMEALAERIRSSRIELEDIRESIEQADSKVNLSEDRLNEVEGRISLLYSLMQKHRCANIDELIAKRDEFGQALFDGGALQEKLQELEQRSKKAADAHKVLCAEISKARKASAPALAKDILETLRYLELDRAVFAVNVDPAEPGANGTDSVWFAFSATGAAPVDLAKCASGGEVSRIMLSLKAMLARFTGMPTMIFDEIDTGVSGSAADRMGATICRMGEDMQVIAITHLPQVAAKGNAHFVVAKTDDGDRAVSGIRRIEGEERVQEIARLLSGASITPEAVANARSLLGEK